MRRILFFLLVILTTQFSVGQNIGIGTTTPNSKAILDINSTTKGILVPSMTSIQRLAITSPPNGLLVYDTDKSEFYHFNATAWSPLLNGDYWSRPNANRRRISNLLDSVGVGLSSPTEWLDVDGNIRSRDNLMADANVSAGGTISGNGLLITTNMVIGGTGVVGSNLQTNGDFTVNKTGATIQLKDAGENKGYFQIAGDNVRLGTNSGNDLGNLIIRMDGTDRIFVDESGAMGIGVSTPTEKLDVAGNINFSGKVTSTQTGNQPLTPICWGMNNINGGLIRGTPNVNVTHIAEGHYRIICPSITTTSVPFIVGRGAGAMFGVLYSVAGQLDIYIYYESPSTGNTEPIDQIFSFMIY